MKVRIEIDTRTFVRFWLVVIGFAVAALAIYRARVALEIVGAALFLALALNNPVSYIARHLPSKSRVGGTAIAYVVVLVILAMFVFLIIPPIVQQTAKFAVTVPSLIDSATNQWHGLDHFMHQYHLEAQLNSALDTIKGHATGWASHVGQNILSGVGSLLSIIATIFLVLVLSFLMLVEGPAWLKRIWGIYNDEDKMEHHRHLAHRMYNVVTGYISGQLTVAGIGAVGSGIAVFVIGLIFGTPTNLALPAVAIAFTLALIPMFGTTAAGVLIALLLLFNNVTAGIVFAIYFVVYQQIENNFISPVIQARRVELSALAVLVSVVIGLYMFGLAGGIISIPIAGCVKVLLEEYLAQARRNRIKSEKPITKLVKKLQGEES